MLILRELCVVKGKIFLGFKYIRFKPSVKYVSTVKTTADASNLRSKKLAEILDCSDLTAKVIIKNNNSILRLDSEDFIRNSTFCSKYLTITDIVEFPALITLNSSMLQHRYFSLMELGCVNISASDILRFPQVIKKTPKQLKREDIYFCHKRSLEHFENYLPNSEIIRDPEVKLRLQKMYDDGSNLWKIKESMNAEFLSSKLDCSLHKAHQMFHRYPPLRVQSILITTHLIDVLFEKYKFSISKVFQAPNLLSLHHEIAVQFLRKTPSILGVKTTDLASRTPLLLRRPVDVVHQVEEILKEFGISEQQLLCCPRVITYTPRTVRLRLEYLCSSEDFALLKSYKQFLWLVYHYSNLKPRLQALKIVDKPCSISMFIVSKANFGKYLGIDCKYRAHLKDTCHYLAAVFKCSEQKVFLKLQEFPNLNNTSVNNSNRIVEYLLGAGVSKEQLFNGLGIIFYDVDIVKLYFEDLQSNSAYQPFSEWSVHNNLIQLLIYAIEVNSGFKFSEIRGARARSDDSDELIAGYAC